MSPCQIYMSYMSYLCNVIFSNERVIYVYKSTFPSMCKEENIFILLKFKNFLNHAHSIHTSVDFFLRWR